MKWLQGVPREEGFYWWRYNDQCTHPILAEIVRTKTFGLTAIQFNLDSKDIDVGTAFYGQYSEKIPMPEYASPHEFGDDEEATSCQK